MSRENFAWQCPFCGQHTTVTGYHCTEKAIEIYLPHRHGKQAFRVRFITCANPACRELCIDAGLGEYVEVTTRQNKYREPHTRWSLRPEANVKQFPDYVPAPIIADYEEACRVLQASPKASATLSRRCLQGMIRDFWKVSKPRLVDEIDAIEDLVDAETWNAIHAVREIGNVGAHMQRDVNEIIDVEPGEAEALIHLVETLISEWYVNREERTRRMARVVDAAAGKKSAKQLPKAAAPLLQITEGETEEDFADPRGDSPEAS